ncbi:MAG TPA: peptidylprolyl isomerase [Prolixibacteraceae bacterium]|nr:peptidylprolyl isomerase [Prolixibacteraceae bacterium]
MKIILLYAILNLFFLSLFAQKTPSCLIKTSLGDIRVDLYPDLAPLTVANFLKYADQHLYDGTFFYRVCTPENEKERKVKIEVIQGGDVPEAKQFDPIRMETTKQTGLKHQNGTLSMARDTPDSATSSFFICIGNQPELDFAGKRNPDGQGFAAFGKVTKGMHVVKKIQLQENKDQYLVSPVKIHSIQRLYP